MIIDIETTGLNPMINRITCISTNYNNITHSFISSDEKLILKEFFETVNYNNIEKIIGFNLVLFDIPFIIKRALINNIPLPKNFLNKQFIDLRKIVNCFNLTHNKYEKGNLNDWAKIILNKEKTTNGLEVIEAFNKGDYNTIKKHCEEDVLITKELYNRCKEIDII